MNFTEHVDVTCKKLGQRVRVFNRIKRRLPLKERTLYYNVMIKYYMLNIYLSENLERVFKLQKRAARVILDVDTRERSPRLFKD